MSQPEGPNPEHRSNTALWVFCIGVGLCTLAYVLGIGAILAAALSGGDPAVVMSTLLGGVGVVLLGAVGTFATLVGGVWMIIRVIADQTADVNEKRYRDVER